MLGKEKDDSIDDTEDEESVQEIIPNNKSKILKELGLHGQEFEDDANLLKQHMSLKIIQERQKLESLKNENLTKIENILCKATELKLPADMLGNLINPSRELSISNDSPIKESVESEDFVEQSSRQFKRQRKTRVKSPLQISPSNSKTQHRRYKSEIPVFHDDLCIKHSIPTMENSQPRQSGTSLSWVPQQLEHYQVAPIGYSFPRDHFSSSHLPPQFNRSVPFNQSNLSIPSNQSQWQSQDIPPVISPSKSPALMHVPHFARMNLARKSSQFQKMHRRTQSATMTRMLPEMSTFTISKSPQLIDKNQSYFTTPDRKNMKSASSSSKVNFLIHTPKHPPKQ